VSSHSPEFSIACEAGRIPPLVWPVLFLSCAASLAFVRFGVPLQEPQEARYAEIPRQMLVEGKWLVPVLYGEPYLDKPPLLYWLVMASYLVFGVHDWAARIVPCSAAFLTMVVTYLWGRRVLGPRGGFLAGMILCLSVRYVYLGRMLTMDTLLCLFVVAALAGAHLAVRGPEFRWRPWVASALACGLGLLAKGPVALVLVVVPVLVFPFVVPKAARPRFWAWLAYASVAAGIALPWYLTAMAASPAFVEYFFWRHHVERFVTPFDHQEPFWFYLPGIFLGMLPWTLLVPGMLRSLVVSFTWPGPSLRGQGPGSAGASQTQPRPRDVLVFSNVALAWCVVFFSIAGCKRPGYILPAMPLLALGLGCYLDGLFPAVESFAALWRHGPRLAYVCTFFVLVVGIGGALFAVEFCLMPRLIGLALALVASVDLLGLGWLGWQRGPKVSWMLFGVTTFTLLFAGTYEVLPGYARRFSMRGQVRPHAAECVDASVHVACYPRRWDSVSFYLGRNDVCSYSAEERPRLVADLASAPRTLLFVKSNRALEDLLRDLPASHQFVPSGRRGTIVVGYVVGRDRALNARYAQR